MGKCPSCGIVNAENAQNCRMCGYELLKGPVGTATEWKCNFCGSMNPIGTRSCSVCTKKVTYQPGFKPQSPKKEMLSWSTSTTDYGKWRSVGPGLAGFMMIVCGVIGLISIILQWAVMSFLEPWLSEAFVPQAILLALLAVVSIVGGVASIERKFWPLAELGAVFSIVVGVFAPQIICLATFIMGFVALLLVSISSGEFS